MNANSGWLVAEMISQFTRWGLFLALYFLEAGAIYTIARRRGIHKPWLAWIPVANMWLFGCIADQYQYVVKGRDTNRRKTLLALEIVRAVLLVVLTVLLAVLLVNVFTEVLWGNSTFYQVFTELLSSSMAALVCGLLLLGVSIAKTVFYAIAMYDVYISCDPRNNVLYLILSLVFPVVRPFFLFFGCRDKDDGMPPRRRSAVV